MNYDFNHAKPAIVSCQLYKLVMDLLKHELAFIFAEALDYVLNHVGTLNVLKSEKELTYERKLCHMSSEHPLKEFLFGLQVY